MMNDQNAIRYDDAEIKQIINATIEETIGFQSYQQSKMNTWSSNIVEIILGEIKNLRKPFKYVVTCVIMQKNGAALHTASSCFWDSTSDHSSTIHWENRTMYAVVSVFGLSI